MLGKCTKYVCELKNKEGEEIRGKHHERKYRPCSFSRAHTGKYKVVLCTVHECVL